MEIRHSQHFLERQTLRKIPSGLAEEVFLNADAHFYDSITGTYVAVKRLPFFDVERDVALVYRYVGGGAYSSPYILWV